MAKAERCDRSFARLKRDYASQFMQIDAWPQKARLTQVTDKLYLGSVGTAHNFRVLKALNVTHILTVCDCLLPKFPEVSPRQHFTYKVVAVSDSADADISAYFDESIAFIQDSLNRGGVVLVHCFAGVSRSATVVAAFLIASEHIDADQALALLRQLRSWVNPNAGFVSQLHDFYLKLDVD